MFPFVSVTLIPHHYLTLINTDKCAEYEIILVGETQTATEDCKVEKIKVKKRSKTSTKLTNYNGNLLKLLTLDLPLTFFYK